MLAETLGKDGLVSTSTDEYKDVWIKMDVLPDGKEYYSMALVYIDNIFFIHKDTSVIIDALEIVYVMKQGSMVPPDRYLGEKLIRCRRRTLGLCGRHTAEIIARHTLQI